MGVWQCDLPEAINELVDGDTELAEYGTQRPAIQFAVQRNSGGGGRLLLNHHVASTLTGDRIAEAFSECLDQILARDDGKRGHTRLYGNSVKLG